MSPDDHEIGIDAQGNLINGFATVGGVVNFLGIPFGQIEKRFCAAKRLSLADIGPSINATKWGPCCPQSRNYGRERRSHLYEGHIDHFHHESEEDCLNLNLFVPEEVIGTATKLPVMVWIHGGGWVFGNGGSDYGKYAPSSADRPDKTKMATGS